MFVQKKGNFWSLISDQQSCTHIRMLVMPDPILDEVMYIQTQNKVDLPDFVKPLVQSTKWLPVNN